MIHRSFLIHRDSQNFREINGKRRTRKKEKEEEEE
ncbi:hypothetical protein LINPERHAP2_LOCUS17115 [Linum perenne]